MSTEVTYTELRANLATLWDEAEANREPILVSRRGKEKMALIPVEELSGIMETAHLLRSPRNTERLLEALGRARRSQVETETVLELRKSLGIEKL